MMDRSEFHKVLMPSEMIGRPKDHRGFPVPWFVTEKTDDGLWDFVRVKGERMVEAIRSDVCWVSGHRLGKFRSFVIGPMCVVNRVAADPPVKKSIGVWSAQICPFLTRPLARRSRDIQPEEYQEQRGHMIERNPGCCAIYTVKRGSYPIHKGLFHLPEPESVEWYSQGRPATKAEVRNSMDTGIDLLADMALKEGDEAVAELNRYWEKAMKLLPAA